MDNKQCFVELDEVLEQLSDENLKKIPIEMRNAIKKEKDTTYYWKYDKTKTLEEQNLNRKTIAMLSYLNIEYLLNDKQKEAVKKICSNIDVSNAEKNKEKYNPDNIFKKNKMTSLNYMEAENKKNEELVEYNENIFNKMINFIKKLLKLK